MANMLLDPIMKKIISAGFLYLKDQVRWQTGMKEELVKLQEILPQIQALVHFASSQEQITDQNPHLNKWRWQLRDAIDDAYDVVDELEYMELQEQDTKIKKLRRVRSIMKSMRKRLVKIGKRALKFDPTLKRLEAALQKLHGISTTGVDKFLVLVKDAKEEHQKQQLELHGARETGSLPDNDLIGRGKEKEQVMEWLGNPSNVPLGSGLYRNISLMSIVGHGGMGKTALLQHVYKDEITKGFELKMWVSASNKFDVKKVIAAMLECLKEKLPGYETLAALQRLLEEEVRTKKFLLVLDDIWEEHKNIWEDVLPALASGGFGSKILVTTRTDSVALMFDKVIKKKTEKVKLNGLEEDKCLQLLYSHAFAGLEEPHDDHQRLRSIAEEMVKKLLGSPLAAKVIGGVLKNNLDERDWRTVLESNLLDQNSIHSILKLSYIVLPNLLQNCFAFCCMFPQDHTFDKDDLVRMWIALGFIQPSQRMIVEDIGRRYFDVLVEKNLFDKVKVHYKMHDLIHESASIFFEHEFIEVVDDKNSSLNISEISETIRHMSVLNAKPDISKKIEKFKHLHSLFLFYKASSEDICSSLIEIFRALKSLRLLYVYAPDLEMIPEDIRKLIHLRYLKIVGYSLTMLPRSLSNLYQLQYIIYDSPSYDGPEELGQHNRISSIHRIGKLKSLQELNMFDLRDVSGYRIGELEHMNDLCKLGINCLENVKNAEEACSANLCEKGRLTDLTLCWSWNHTDSRNTYLDENVLDNLRPPKCLRNLCIKRYMGARSAIWMNNVNLISYLEKIEKIELADCLEWETLPPFGQLRFLKSLTLSNMPKVKWLESKFNGNEKYRAFPLLEVLHITKLKTLEDWFEAGVAAEDGCLFPCLIQLELHDCPKLKELPSLPSMLKSLMIRSTGWKTLNCCSLSNYIPLATLEVIHCPNITSLPLADEIARLAALRSLTITKCTNLISLGRYREVETTNNCHLILSDLSISDPSVLLMEPLRSIASLKKLRIEDNDELVSFPNEAEQWFLNVSSSLCELEFGQLKSLQSLPSSLGSLYSLQKLSITKCPNLISRGSYREEETTNNCHLMLSVLEINDPSVLLMEPLRSIASLEILKISDNDEVVSFPNEEEQWFLNVRSSLCELEFIQLKSLQSLPSSLESLSSLQKLFIDHLRMLRELPNLPPSLKTLHTWDLLILPTCRLVSKQQERGSRQQGEN